MQQGSASLWGWLLLLLLALVVVIPSCGDDPSPASVPTPTTVPTETLTPVPTSTPEPSEIDQVLENRQLAIPTPTSPPMATPTLIPAIIPTATATPELTATPVPERPIFTPTPSATTTTADTPAPHDSDPDCPAGGGLDDGPTISRCNNAVQASLTSFSFTMRMSLAGLLPAGPPDGDLPSLEMTGTLVLPDQFLYNLSVGVGDEALDVRVIAIGDDIFVQEPFTRAVQNSHRAGLAGFAVGDSHSRARPPKLWIVHCVVVRGVVSAHRIVGRSPGRTEVRGVLLCIGEFYARGGPKVNSLGSTQIHHPNRTQHLIL